jgi:N-acetylmuramoyl-L-alanine amidase
MNHQGRKVQALMGSRILIVGKERFTLSAPLRKVQGAVIVPPDFERIVFGTAGAGVPGTPVVRRSGKIVIDAGHGGKDPGAIGYGGLKEKDVNMDIALRTAQSLRRAGFDVLETRSTDVFISLADRTAEASRPGVDLFISFHANATKSRRARGFEVYYTAPLNLQDRCDDQRQLNEKKICARFNMRRDAPDLRGIVMDMLYAFKIGEAPRLAEAVNRGLARGLGEDSRGSKTARFFVLRNTLVPAVLVEVGFISNPREAMQLKDPDHRQKIADAVTQGVMRYFHASGL